MRCATSIRSPFVRWSVIPVARKMWQPIAILIPALKARRRTTYQTSVRDVAAAPSFFVFPIRSGAAALAIARDLGVGVEIPVEVSSTSSENSFHVPALYSLRSARQDSDRAKPSTKHGPRLLSSPKTAQPQSCFPYPTLPFVLT
jgi:hypothetical protein